MLIIRFPFIAKIPLVFALPPNSLTPKIRLSILSSNCYTFPW